MTLNGFVFFDGNGNQKLDYNEAGDAGDRVYEDLSNTGSYTASDPSTLTYFSGLFTLAGLFPNASHQVIIRVVPNGSFVSEISSSGLSPSSGAVFTQTFGISGVNEIGGSVDAVVSGGYIGSSGQTLYLDLNNDGVLESNEPSVQTDGYGNYSFGSVAAGTYVLRIQPLAGFTIAAGSDTSKTLTVGSTGDYGWSFTVAPQSITNDGAIYGQLYNDANQNGVDDLGETPLEGRTVYIDSNDDGTLDAGDVSTQTNSVGEYGFYGLAAGTYVVRQVVPAGVTSITGAQSITLKPANYGLYTYSGVNFGSNTPGSSIYGNVFDDVNKDNVQETNEPGLAGWTVFIDQNDDGKLDTGDLSTTTDASGHYLFTGLSNGNYGLTIVPPFGWTKTVSEELLAQVVLGRSAVQNFGAHLSSSRISGTVFNDFNGNGTQDTGEPDLAGRTVYLDLNGDGQFDAGDVSTTSTSTGFSFPNVTPGTYSVREVLPTGWERTAAAGDPSIVVNVIANAISSASFGTLQPTLTAIAGGPYTIQPGGKLTLDATGSVDTGNNIISYEWDENYNGQTFNPTATGATTAFSTSGLTAGVTRTVAVRVTDAAGLVRIATTTVAVLNAGTVTGEVLYGPQGETVYLDANNNGQLDPGEPSTTAYDIDPFGGPGFEFDNVPAGNYMLRQVVPGGYVQDYPFNNAGTPITVSAGQTVNQDLYLEYQSQASSVSGTVINGMPGETVFINYNNTGLPAGNPSTTLGSNDTFTIGSLFADTFTLLQVLPAGYTQVAPAGNAGITFTLKSGENLTGQNFVDSAPASAGGSISGTVTGGPTGETIYLDANNNSLLDPTELSTTTSSTGAFSFTGVPAGAYVVRQVLPGGYTQTTPAGGLGIHISVTNGGSLAGENFTDKPPVVVTTGSVAGAVIGGPTGETIFLDANGNGTLDPGELSTTPSSTGSFSFASVPAGSYVLRQVLSGGYTQTTPANAAGIAITVVAGAALMNENFTDAAPAAVGGSVGGVVTGGPAGETIYLDANNNSVLDSTELSTTTSSTGAFSFSNVPVGAYVVRQMLSGGYTQTSPASGYGIHVSVTKGGSLTGENFTDKPPVVVTTGSISGVVNGGLSGETVFLDANANGVLDGGELSTTTSATGAFSFSAVPVGSYTLRQVLSGGYTQTVPAGNAGIGVNVTAGGSITSENFTDTAPAATGGSVSGTVTGSVAGEVIYLDANNDSKLDTGELSATTSATGTYSFTGVPAGAYVVRQVLPSGFTQTSPSGGLGIHITVASSSNLTGENFTDQPPAVVHTRLTGTTIGTAGSYDNDGNTIAMATDGNTSTYFDGQASSGNWVGYDLGSAMTLTQIAYASRNGYASRLVGGQIQVSTTADFSSGVTTIDTIGSAPASGLTTITLASPVTARYIRYLSPAASHGDISEFEVFS